MITTPPPVIYYTPAYNHTFEIQTTSTFSKSSHIGLFNAYKTESTSNFNSYIDRNKIIMKAQKLDFVPPTTSSLIDAEIAVKELMDLSIDVEGVNPTEDGGVLIEFFKDDTFHMIDIYNDGDTLFVRGGDSKAILDITRDFKTEFRKLLK